ncbi:MAG: PQQ-binding-like beta-propeller repeat protein [Planctomycetes bacterium]|nr:PQQ-binding-like beta-propeller repeat protein [Planctomycetota bacterium]
MTKIFLFVLILSLPVLAQDWLQWRGPSFDGRADKSLNVPDEWSVENKSNLKWATSLKQSSSSSPIICGDRIFLSSSDNDYNLYAHCYSLKNGELIWEKKLGQGEKMMRNGPASASPVSDKKVVVFSYGEGSLFAFNLEGKALWQINLQEKFGLIGHKFGFSSTPLCDNGVLYQCIAQNTDNKEESSYGSPKSYIIALNMASGKLVWKIERKGAGKAESMDSYATPIIYKLGSKRGLITIGSDIILCSDLKNGKEIWRYDYTKKKATNWRVIPTPVQCGDMLGFSLPRGKSFMVLKCPQNNLLKKPVQHALLDGPFSDVASPAYDGKNLYVVGGKPSTLSCISPEKGEVLWQDKLDKRSSLYASPVVIADKVYSINLSGKVTIYSTGDKKEKIAEFTPSKNESNIASSFALSDKYLIMRTNNYLMCVQKSSVK